MIVSIPIVSSHVGKVQWPPLTVFNLVRKSCSYVPLRESRPGLTVHKLAAVGAGHVVLEGVGPGEEGLFSSF